MNRCHFVAPSTSAASYTSSGMACSPARKIKVMIGSTFHMSATATVSRVRHPPATVQETFCHLKWTPGILEMRPANSPRTEFM